MRRVLSIGVLLALMAIATTVVDASPGLLIDITPVKDKVLPGETASYKVNITNLMSWAETVHLRVENPITGWSYTFSENDFNLPAYASKTVDMYITVASDASPGDYYHDVKAEGKVFGITVEETVYTNILTTVIPEFKTIGIPVVAILGLVLLFNRRK